MCDLKTLLLLLVWCSVFWQGISGLACFTCSSRENGECGSQFAEGKGEVTVAQCSGLEARCYTTTVEFNGIMIQARGCTSKCMMPDADLGGLENLNVVKLDCCGANNCNDKIPDGVAPPPTTPPPVSLQCYSCESDSSGPCSDKDWDSSSSAVTTSSCFGSCAVKKQTINGMTTFMRSCVNGACVATSDVISGVSTSVKCCSESFCNEGDPDLAPTSITCYSCNSIDDVNCGDAAWSSSGLDTVICDGYCAATKTTITGNEVIVRGCSKTCDDYMAPNGKIVSRCCQDNYCNRGQADGSVNPPLLMCYECTSSGDDNCGEQNFDTNMVPGICQGLCKTTKEFNNDGSMTITRECAEESCEEGAGPSGDVNCCDYDNCLPNIDPVTINPYTRQCYECNSEDEAACADSSWLPYEIGSVQCGGPCQTIITKKDNTMYYQRSCAKFCAPSSSGNSVEVQCCEKDFCNKPVTAVQSEVTCFQCSSFFGEEDCGAALNPSGLFVAEEKCRGMCKISYSKIEDTKIFARSCDAECEALDIDLGSLVSVVQCCSSDHCNTDLSTTAVTLAPGQFYCYQCVNVLGEGCGVDFDTGADYLQKQICDSMCAVSYLNSETGTLITRSCDPECEESDVDAFNIRVKSTCCRDNLCNTDIGLDGGVGGQASVSCSLMLISSLLLLLLLNLAQ